MMTESEEYKAWMKKNLPGCYDSVVDTLGQEWTVLGTGEPAGNDRYWKILKSGWDREVEYLRSNRYARYHMESELWPGNGRYKTVTWSSSPFGESMVAIVDYEYQHTDVNWMSWEEVGIRFAVSHQTLSALDQAMEWMG